MKGQKSMCLFCKYSGIKESKRSCCLLDRDEASVCLAVRLQPWRVSQVGSETELSNEKRE